MKPLSVAIIGTRGYPSFYGGFETAVRHIAPYLHEHGWAVTVYGRPGQIKESLNASRGGVNSVITRGFERRSLSTLSYGWSAARHARRTRPDVALVMNVANGFFLQGLKQRGIATVVNVDGIEWEREKWSHLGKAAFKTGARLTAKYSTKIVVDSTEIGERWRKEFKRDGDFIPYGGESIEGMLPLEPRLTHRGYALAVARFVPENTIPEFLSAAETISRTHDVVIVGSAGYGGELDDRAKHLNETNPRIHWLGHISDDQRLHSLWQHSGAYFHGHSVGGTNPALVQAMACGAPIVARETKYNREVLQSSGEFCEPRADQIANSILSLLQNPARQESLSAKSIERARSKYTWNQVCAAYEESLLSAIQLAARK